MGPANPRGEDAVKRVTIIMRHHVLTPCSLSISPRRLSFLLAQRTIAHHIVIGPKIQSSGINDSGPYPTAIPTRLQISFVEIQGAST